MVAFVYILFDETIYRISLKRIEMIGDIIAIIAQRFADRQDLPDFSGKDFISF
jgi:hypothetical protein